MGRQPTVNTGLPKGMRARVKAKGVVWYYYDTGGKPRREIPLGNDYIIAVRKWADLEISAEIPLDAIITFKYLGDRYLKSTDYLEKSARTQKDYLNYLEMLYKYFNDPPAPIDQIEPHHINKYLEWRNAAPVSANREKAMFSIVWNYARAQGITKLTNPCAGIKGFTETSRAVYIEDEIYNWVWGCADVPLRDAMDLAYLAGQRPADTLKYQETDMKDGCLEVSQGKTKVKRRIEIIGEFKLVIDRIMARKQTYKIRSLALIANEQGKRLTQSALVNRFRKAREKAIRQHPYYAHQIKQFQFRDLRAKAGTDKADSENIQAAQQQLGHKSITTTEIYIRNKRGAKVTPTK